MSQFDVYGKMASSNVCDDIIQNGRYSIQSDAETHIPSDVFTKLNLTADDVFLDIGCGLGLNLKPATKIANKVVGCDHPNVIKKLLEKEPDLKAELIGGNFLETRFPLQYTKILSYSVLHTMPDIQTLYQFVDKVLELLHPCGKALLGDMANIDKKKRFLDTQAGKRFQKTWDKLRTETTQEHEMSDFHNDEDITAVVLTDDVVLKLIQYIRNKGFHAYLLDQPQNLPFGHTREDLLIVGPEYEDFIHRD